jgi:hypothetical protein
MHVYMIHMNVQHVNFNFLKKKKDDGKRTIVDFTELEVLAAFSKVGADATVLVVIGVDDGVLGARVALNEEKKLLEQHVDDLDCSCHLSFFCFHATFQPIHVQPAPSGWADGRMRSSAGVTLAVVPGLMQQSRVTVQFCETFRGTSRTAK